MNAVVGNAIRLLVRSPARQVLLTRELRLRDGGTRRWVAADFRVFLRDFRLEVARLRPLADQQTLPTKGSRLMVEFALATTAAYRVLASAGIDLADARAAVADIGWIVYRRLLALVSLPYRLTSRDPAKRLQRTIRTLLWFPFNGNTAPGYEVRSWVEHGNIHTEFTHCPPQSFVRTLVRAQGDGGELQAFAESWCRYDWPGADLIASDGADGHYRRPHTLSAGDNVCDMCWLARGALGSPPMAKRGSGHVSKTVSPTRSH